MITLDHTRPLWTLTVAEFMELTGQTYIPVPEAKPTVLGQIPTHRPRAYGIEGLASVLGCGKTKAGAIKATGALDGAITQMGRTIIIDADKALDLAKIYFSNHPNLITKKQKS